MDDKEYYSIKRISTFSVEELQKNLIKKQSQKNILNINIDSTYKNNLTHQGHDDAEMLLEKQKNYDSI